MVCDGACVCEYCVCGVCTMSVDAHGFVHCIESVGGH